MTAFGHRTKPLSLYPLRRRWRVLVAHDLPPLRREAFRLALRQEQAHEAIDHAVVRHRMLDDMRMRKLAPQTQAGCIRAVRSSPHSPLAARPTPPPKGTCGVTLDRGELMTRMQPVRTPQTLPVVLSVQETLRLIAAARNLKHHTSLSVAYGAVRASEAIEIKSRPSRPGNSRNTTG